jgi:predicted dehydrogenase
MSFDVVGAHTPSLLYGTEGTLTLPDPNAFAAGVHLYTKAQPEHTAVDLDPGYDGLRGIGVADLALAVRTGCAQHASGALAFHVLDVMSAVLDAAETSQAQTVASTVERPPALDLEELRAGLAAVS